MTVLKAQINLFITESYPIGIAFADLVFVTRKVVKHYILRGKDGSSIFRTN